MASRKRLPLSAPASSAPLKRGKLCDDDNDDAQKGKAPALVSGRSPMEGGDEAVAGSQRLFQLCHIGHLTPQQNRGRLRFEDLFTLGTLTGMAQFNYMIDLDWLRAKLPSAAGVSDLPMWVFHGFRHAEDCRLLEKQAARFKHMQLYKPPLPAFGTHHTKMMLLFYAEGMRLVVHTGNLIPRDYAYHLHFGRSLSNHHCL